MANKTLREWPFWAITLALLLILHWITPHRVLALDQTATNGSETLEELGALQRDIRLLKMTLERLKLQRELARLQPTHAIVIEICQPGAGISTPTLNAIYGVKGHYVAMLSYNSLTQIEARRGERLLCGETVLSIGLDRVTLEKNGKRYHITSNVTVAPSRISTPALTAVQ